jgi:hypothetical protein
MQDAGPISRKRDKPDYHALSRAAIRVLDRVTDLF